VSGPHSPSTGQYFLKASPAECTPFSHSHSLQNKKKPSPESKSFSVLVYDCRTENWCQSIGGCQKFRVTVPCIGKRNFFLFRLYLSAVKKRLHLVKRPRSVLFIFAQIKHLPRFRSVWILLKLSTVQHDSSATKLIKWMDRLIVNHCTGLIKVAWLYSNCRSQQNCVKRTSTPLLLTRLAMGSWAKSLSPGKHRTYKTQGRSLTLMARSRFRYFLTLLTECFAPFDRSTCALSVLCRY